MPRRRKDRPIEELRSTWTSTADLEETIAAMFPRPNGEPPFPALPQPALNLKDLSSPDTVVVDSPDTVAAESTDTVAPESADTVVVVPEDTVAAEPTDTVAGGPTDTVVLDPADTVVVEPTATVSLEPTDTVAVASAETVADERLPGLRHPTDTVSSGPADTVSAGLPAVGLWQVEAGGVFPASRIRRIGMAQDALTHAEEAVYDVLWGPKNQSRDVQRSVSMGYDAIAKAARVTKMNAKWIVERLINKGFVKIDALPDTLRRIPTRYAVFSYRAALDNMIRSNRFYVVRTGNGVMFAHPLNPADTVSAEPPDTVSVGPGTTVAVEPAATAPAGQPTTVSPGAAATVSPAETHLGSTSQALTPSIVTASILREFGFVDDDAIQTLIRRCRENAPDATYEEIAELGAMCAREVSRMRGLEKPVGMLIKKTANCFVGASFAIYRRDRSEREEKIRKLYEEVES
jgi:hypothetical protein